MIMQKIITHFTGTRFNIPGTVENITSLAHDTLWTGVIGTGAEHVTRNAPKHMPASSTEPWKTFVSWSTKSPHLGVRVEMPERHRLQRGLHWPVTNRAEACVRDATAKYAWIVWLDKKQ